ncbi:MAG: peptidylprolyl isomerase [Chloroflexi bacterium]|nr:peptidylprolyl isomerase [Chloroflexota bacterium]
MMMPRRLTPPAPCIQTPQSDRAPHRAGTDEWGGGDNRRVRYHKRLVRNMSNARKSLPVLVAAAFLAGCGGSKPGDSETSAKVEPAPDTYHVKFETNKGDFVVEVTKAWAPEGAERFYLLVRRGFYNDARFFRVLPNFIVQFGINGDPAISRQWRTAMIPDDPVKESNKRGTITFATSGPNTRTTQVFINLADNARLDSMGFAPFGRVIAGMNVVERFFSAYGEGAPQGNGPDQNLIETQGNVYIENNFPRLDYISAARIVP